VVPPPAVASPGDPSAAGPVQVWRVKAPGFGGRLFFVGPVVELFPVNEFAVDAFELARSRRSGEEEEDPRGAVLALNMTRGEIEGTPESVVRWINRAYRAERTRTEVTVDARAATVTAAVDVKVLVGVPAAFRFVDREKIRAGMTEALTPKTEEAIGRVCDEVAAAWVEWAEGGWRAEDRA
jgi:hypothetical protein